jgi:hypothetical protein
LGWVNRRRERFHFAIFSTTECSSSRYVSDKQPVPACLLLMHRPLDESLAVYVVFRTPLLEDGVLRSYLARLLVNVEVFAFSTAPPPDQDPKAGPPKELIHSGTINHTDEPTVVNHGEGDDAYTYVIWKVNIFICESFESPSVELHLISGSSPSRQIPQACGILPAHGILQACGTTQERRV